jgi:hypothetical protein
VDGGADGTFGLATTKAVMDFQRRRGLKVSGVVDDDTAVALGIGPGSPPAGGAASNAVPAAPAPTAAAESAAIPLTGAGHSGWLRRVLAVFALLAGAVVARGQQVKRRRLRLRQVRSPEGLMAAPGRPSMRGRWRSIRP